MSLKIASNFSYLGAKPLDDRLVFETVDAMTSTASSQLYDGMLVYNKETKQHYIYEEVDPGDATSGNSPWKEIDLNTNVNNLPLREYEQGKQYSEDSLIYHKSYLARVLQDFTADITEINADESFTKDINDGNIFILNPGVEPEILPYTQHTFYLKDKLVYGDSRIGKVLQDFISDNTASTLEEAINIDIANGNLREMADDYRFKLYYTTVIMDKAINETTVISLDDIVFENGETVANMKLNEGVYGSYGTLAIITNIDTNNNEITVKTINARTPEIMPPAPKEHIVEITVSGSGYQVGDEIPTNLPNEFYVVVDEVDEDGGIQEVTLIPGTTTSTPSGYGAIIAAIPVLYAGHGDEWFKVNSSDDIISESTSGIEPYTPGKIYKKNSLIYFDNVEYRSVIDFQASDSETEIEDNLNIDIQQGYLIRMTPESVNIPEFVGTIMTDEQDDLDIINNPVAGNWGLVIDCTVNAPGQPGIAVYTGTSWSITPIPQGELQFPEPSQEGKRFFRIVPTGQDSGAWEEFTEVNGNDVTITINTNYSGTDVPELGELCWRGNELVIGDGSTDIMSLEPFYATSMTRDDLINLIGFEPENIDNKGKVNGYAPLDADGLVPKANLPLEVTDTYSKTQIDNKDTNILNSATLLVNNEAARATTKETEIETTLNDHIDDNSLHVTQSEKDIWDSKVDSDDLLNYDNHISDTEIHVTQDDKDRWDGMNKAYFVHSVSELPLTDNQIGNIGYVQTSASGVTPIICDQYMWNGTQWEKVDTSGVSLTFNWGNLQGKPASTPLTIDNTVTVAHKHVNFNVLEKIGQNAQGEFTWNDRPIGIQAVFLNNENSLPDVGEENVLYIVYEDSRVRNFPSISVYRDDAFQILGRGTQDAPPTVGEMSILQAEYFNVKADSTFNITISPQTSFCFLPVEILVEQLGKQNIETTIVDTNEQNFEYNENLFDQSNTKGFTFNIKPIPIENDTVSDMYFGHTFIDLNDYYDVVAIG